jgi:hypothetical protein
MNKNDPPLTPEEQQALDDYEEYMSEAALRRAEGSEPPLPYTAAESYEMRYAEWLERNDYPPDTPMPIR